MSAFDGIIARVYAIQEAADNGFTVSQEDWDFVSEVEKLYYNDKCQCTCADSIYDEIPF